MRGFILGGRDATLFAILSERDSILVGRDSILFGRGSTFLAAQLGENCFVKL